MLVRITAPHFVAGICESGIAPIIAYMRGWKLSRIKGYCAFKGWTVEVWP